MTSIEVEIAPLGEIPMHAPEGDFMVVVWRNLPRYQLADETHLHADSTGTLFRVANGAYAQASPDGEFREDVAKYLKLTEA